MSLYKPTKSSLPENINKLIEKHDHNPVNFKSRLYSINLIQGFGTKSIHFGQEPDQTYGSINTPIHMSSTFVQKSPGVLFNKFDYTRGGNPTVDAFEQCQAALDCAKHAIAFPSGCAAISNTISILKSGDQVIVCKDAYRGAERQLKKIFSKFGMEGIVVDYASSDWKKSLNDKVKMLFIETPANPALKIFNIKEICSEAKKFGVITVVDNTFASCYLQSPILLGADIVLTSSTKYISGHSDCVGGVISTNSQSLHDRIKFNLISMGACMSPFNAYLFLRSLKTLNVRMMQHCKNARVIAEYLETHPKIDKVYYPGLKSHPDHELAKMQMRDFGGMVTVYLKGGLTQTTQFLGNLKVFYLGESYGGTESLIQCPALRNYMETPVEQRKDMVVDNIYLRVSIGIEDVEDLINDIDQAFEKVEEVK
jgi:cystathionine gamma-lyase